MPAWVAETYNGTRLEIKVPGKAVQLAAKTKTAPDRMKRQYERQNARRVAVVHDLLCNGTTLPKMDNFVVRVGQHDIFGVQPVAKTIAQTIDWTPNIRKAHRVANNTCEFGSWPRAQNRAGMTTVSGDIQPKIGRFDPTRDANLAAGKRRAEVITPPEMQIEPNDRIVLGFDEI